MALNTTPTPTQSPRFSGSGKGLGDVEDAAVAFLRQFCWAHPSNSRRFARTLLDVLRPIGEPSYFSFTNAILSANRPISSRD